MRSRFAHDSVSAETIDEASRWFVEFRLGELDNEARERFIRWLRASPANIRAYLEIAGTYAEMGPQNAQAEIDVERLIADARAELPIIELPIKGRTPAESPSCAAPLRPRSKAVWALAASVLLVIGGAYVGYERGRDTYQTDIGEQRSLTLADGSRVDLNARSKVRIRFGSQERHIDLLSGQALFAVARDPRRPFVVQAGGSSIRAVGTSFDVNRGRSATTVTVLEGRVAVGAPTLRADDPGSGRGAGIGRESGVGPTPSKVDRAEILLSAGQQLRVSPGAPTKPTAVNVRAVTAWTQHQLIFESTPLHEVVEQFNRYNTRQIVIDDPALETFHVSGYYATPDPTSLLNFLRSEPRIEVLEAQDSIRITRK